MPVLYQFQGRVHNKIKIAENKSYNQKPRLNGFHFMGDKVSGRLEKYKNYCI